MLMLVCFAFAGCGNAVNGVSAADNTEKHETKDNMATGNAVSGKPNTASLEEEDIKSASIMVRPDSFPPSGMGDKKIQLNRSEIKEFSNLFATLSLTQKMNSHKDAEETTGQFIQFDLSLRDGTKKSITICSPYITYDNATYKAEYEPCEKINEFANRIISEKVVSYECDRGKISLYLPDGWSHKIEKYKKTNEDETFGITFWQDKSDKKNGISVQYTKFFGVCGTGLETKKIKINNMESEAGYYDGKPYWDYIMLGKKFKNTFVVLNFCESEAWWKQYGDQVMEILDTLTVKC